jgi:8-oxo-dGTP pyrophosphatase MutT (NUDIX family)
MKLAERWKKISTKVLASFRIFSIREDRYQLPRHEKEASFYVLESSDWVNVIPLTEQGEVVLIRQFRFGTENVTLEIPGGIVDPGHTPLIAARKELLEETGYASDQWEYLGYVHPNPAFLNNRCHSFLAKAVKRIAETAPEESEEFEVVLVPYPEIKNLIGNEGITHSLVVCAFHLFELISERRT